MCQSKEVFSLVRKLLKMLRCRPHRLHSKCALDYTTFIPQQSNQEFVSLNSECKLFLSSVCTLQSGENFAFWSETKCIDYWMSLSLCLFYFTDSYCSGARAAYHSPPHSHSAGYEYECRHQSTSPLPVPRRSRKNSNPYDQVRRIFF